MTLLIDISALTSMETDHVLESMFKARHDPPEDDLWVPHQSPFARDLIERLTKLGLDVIHHYQHELTRALHDGYYTVDIKSDSGAKNDSAPKNDSSARTFDTPERINEFIDWLTGKHWQQDYLTEEVAAIILAACVMGGLQRYIPNLTPDKARKILNKIPPTIPEAIKLNMITPARKNGIEYAQSRVAEQIVALREQTRHRFKSMLLREFDGVPIADLPKKARAIEQLAREEFPTLNRDYRRIVITEIGGYINRVLIAGCEEGTKLRRLEKYPKACVHCRAIDDRIYTVVSPDKPDKDGETEVWRGKTNIGRSASPRKRVGDRLVDRSPDERLWAAEDLMHPNCRGTWQVVNPPPAVPAWIEEER
ncbi:MAG: hypothetical protein LBS40_05470 [Burkholderiales bacterium]|jgi:hypothetical protein|nr:hypothetical protein [Burkholderiales bacterium]